MSAFIFAILIGAFPMTELPDHCEAVVVVLPQQTEQLTCWVARKNNSDDPSHVNATITTGGAAILASLASIDQESRTYFCPEGTCAQLGNVFTVTVFNPSPIEAFLSTVKVRPFMADAIYASDFEPPIDQDD